MSSLNNTSKVIFQTLLLFPSVTKAILQVVFVHYVGAGFKWRIDFTDHRLGKFHSVVWAIIWAKKPWILKIRLRKTENFEFCVYIEVQLAPEMIQYVEM